MKRFYENLKRQAQEHPVETLIAAAVLLTATSKAVEANSNRSNSHAWDRETRRRERKSMQ